MPYSSNREKDKTQLIHQIFDQNQKQPQANVSLISSMRGSGRSLNAATSMNLLFQKMLDLQIFKEDGTATVHCTDPCMLFLHVVRVSI